MNVPPQGPKDDNTREVMQQIAREVDDLLPQSWGFIVLAFPFGDAPGRLNYIANCNRDDALKVISEWLEKTKARPDWGGHT